MHGWDIMKTKAFRPNDPHDQVFFKRMRKKVNAEIKQAEESEELLYKNKFSESGDDRDWRERDW